MTAVAPASTGKLMLFIALGKVVLTQWRRSSNLSAPALAAAACIAVGISATATALLVAQGLPDALAQQPELVAAVIGLTVPLGASLMAVIAGCAGADLTPDRRWLLTMPVSTRMLSLVLAAPGLFVAALIMGLVNSPAVVALQRLTGYGWPHALVSVTALTAAGLLGGRLVVVAARQATQHSPVAAQYLTTVALLSWASFAVISVIVLRGRVVAGVLDDVHDGFQWSSFDAALGWTALFAWILRPRPAAAAALTLLVALLAALVVASAGWRATLGVTASPRARCRRLWSPRRGVLVSLALRRQLRNRRTLSWTASAGAILVCLSAYVSTLDRAAAVSLSANSLLLIAQLSAYQCLLARGLDRRDRPFPLVLGLLPVNYTAAWQVASALVAALLAAVPLTILALAAEDVTLAVAGGLMVASSILVAHAISAVLVPRPGDSGTETAAGALLFGVTVAAGLLGSKALATTELLPVAMFQAALCLCAAPIPALVERHRWHRDIHADTRGCPPARSSLSPKAAAH